MFRLVSRITLALGDPPLARNPSQDSIPELHIPTHIYIGYENTYFRRDSMPLNPERPYPTTQYAG